MDAVWGIGQIRLTLCHKTRRGCDSQSRMNTMKEQLIKTALVLGGLTIASVGAYKAVEAIDSSMTPTYQTSKEFVAPIPDEQVIWQPRTNWGRK